MLSSYSGTLAGPLVLFFVTKLLDNTLLNGFDLSLIGRRHVRSNNSWMHNSLRLIKGNNRCTLMMHPTDAQQRGIENKQLVEVSSNVGEVKIELEMLSNY